MDFIEDTSSRLSDHPNDPKKKLHVDGNLFLGGRRSTHSGVTLSSKMLACVVLTLLSVSSAFQLAPRRAYSSALSVTWSDSKAVKDYQEFLSSGKQEIELADDGPSVIVMPAEGCDLGQALYALGMGDDAVINPGQDCPSNDQAFPIYVTLPPYQLNEFLVNLPESFKERAEDMVFFSGGMEYGNIEDVLKERGEFLGVSVASSCGNLTLSQRLLP